MSDIEVRVKKIIAEQLGVEESQVTNEKAFVADLGADSLDTVELVMALEDEFGIGGLRHDPQKGLIGLVRHPLLRPGVGKASAAGLCASCPGLWRQSRCAQFVIVATFNTGEYVPSSCSSYRFGLCQPCGQYRR